MSRDYVLLIHGTFAADEHDVTGDDGRDRWWQRDSEFYKELRGKLNDDPEDPRFEVCPIFVDYREDYRPWWAKQWKGFPQRAPKDDPPNSGTLFHWSGKNSESSRRYAGHRLLRYLRHVESQCEAESTNSGYHIVAHSHGGAPVWGALCESVREGKSLKRLKSWSSVGTPFLRFAPDWIGYLVAPLIALAVVAWIVWRQWAWWADFWRQQVDAPAHWAAIAWAFVVFYLASITVPSLIAYCGWSYYCWKLSDRDGCRDRYLIEFWTFASGVLALAVFILLTILAVCCGFKLSEELYREVYWPETGWPKAIAAWRQTPAAAAWLIAVGVVIASCLWRILFVFLPASLAQRGDRVLHRIAWKTYGRTYAALASGAAQFDEPINGLRALRRPIRGPLLPRFPSPRSRRYTAELNRPVDPEAELRRSGFAGWIMQSLLLPFALIWHWIIQPIYNEVVAGIIDDYVLSRIRRMLIGEDVPGLVLGEVSVHPYRNDSPPPDIDVATDKLTNLVDERAAGFLKQIRQALGKPWSGGVQFLQMLNETLAGTANSDKSPMAAEEPKSDAANVFGVLYHTNYFEIPEIRRLAIKHIKTLAVKPNAGADEFAARQKLDEREAQRRVPDKSRPGDGYPNPSLGGLLWWTARRATQTAILMLPFIGIYFAGYAVAYPNSLERQTKWAVSVVTSKHRIYSMLVELGVGVANESLDEQYQVLPRAFTAAQFVVPAISSDKLIQAQLDDSSIDNQAALEYFLVEVVMHSDAGEYALAIKALNAAHVQSLTCDDAKTFRVYIQKIVDHIASRTCDTEAHAFVEYATSVSGITVGEHLKSSMSPVNTPNEVFEQAISNIKSINVDVLKTLDERLHDLRRLEERDDTDLASSIESTLNSQIEDLSDHQIEIAAAAILAVAHFRLTGSSQSAMQWLSKLSASIDKELQSPSARDAARVCVASAYADLGSFDLMYDEFLDLHSEAAELVVARRLLCRIAEARGISREIIGRIDRMADFGVGFI